MCLLYGTVSLSVVKEINTKKTKAIGTAKKVTLS